MMLHTKGSHRTVEGYRKLFEKAGFTQLSVIHTPFDKQMLVVRKAQINPAKNL
jgi:hypothetical protein